MTAAETYGRDKVCQRTACTADGPADHVGGAHLDPRDRNRFDGNGTSLRATTYRVRSELYALERVKADHPDLAEVIDVAVHAVLKEIQFLNDQNVHIKVDADRKVREASRNALDCEHHGKTIQGLEEQLTLVDQSGDRSEKGRLALLGGIVAFDEFIRQIDAGATVPDLPKLVAAIRDVLKKTHAAHDRAWKR
ncbi:hypothetical protein Q0Z83_060490 [Actinoplanes sichuanensis]|uniref:Uncharacterized protein n=1 Tax=Actinoplanes sichuanensis TaxID=512349 RepID=A0ABW4A6M3_9ACTN|nr:hypothetical protein [Actinoplanes sichuanensis]BEL07858.1 hypothetical protein Q0Z83_060490 [Actinoplanes sichuanensis]